MKPLRPLIHHSFSRPTSSIHEGGKKSSFHSLVFHLLCFDSTQSSSINSPKNEPTPNNTPSLDSSNYPKPISENACFDLIPSRNTHINEFGNTQLLKSVIPSPLRSNYEPYLFHTSNRRKPIINPPYNYSILHKFIQTRSFSSAPQDPDSSSSSSSSNTGDDGIPPAEICAAIDAGSSNRKPISLWPGTYHSPATNALWEARSRFFENLSNVPIDALKQSELVKKTPSQSRTSILYKFSSDDILREQYRNPWNEIRMGKLLEDLDALAGTISFKHCSNEDNTTRPILLVTASVDKMVLKKPIRIDTDLNIVGSVTWVGRSSMEIQLEVNQSTQETSNSSDSLALIANLTFVARDPKTGKSAPINQISPETEKERLLWEEAEERNKMRRKKRGEEKKKEIGANEEEMNRLNDLLAEGRVFSDMPALADRDSILMKDTCHQNSLICQPQQRNIHGRIFGGFLVRRAFELGFATAYAFAGSAPCFVEVDHVDFLKPVDVGNFLRFKSCVLYTELENPSRPLINVEVVAHVTRPELRSSEVSNKFYFTFTVRSEGVRDGMKIRSVVPATEEEARRVIERMDAETSS